MNKNENSCGTDTIDSTAEDSYWRQQHANQPYAGQSSYDDYKGAYRLGYEGCSRFRGRLFDECEPALRKDYEKNYGKSNVSWDKARHAARAAWSRADRNLERFIGYDVVDQQDNKIGTLECLWSDHNGNPAFVGVKTGWLLGKTHVVPANSVHVSDDRRVIRLPYDEQKVKDAPSYDADCQMTTEKETEIYNYYGVSASGISQQTQSQQRSGATTTGTAKHTPEQATIQLSEEQVKIGKREVEAGGVRLRKVVRTETVNQPVELKREEIIIERVPASEAHTGRQQSFNEQEVYIPLRREEAVIEKQSRLREEVRARKSATTDRQNVSAEVRKEDVEIEKQGEAREADPRGGNAARELREQETQPRSQRRQKTT